MERIVQMGDVAVRLVATDRRRATALERVLGNLPEASGPASVTIHYRREEPPLPTRAPDAMTAEIVAWFDGRTFTAAERSGVSAQVTDEEVWVGGSTFDPAGGFDRLLLLVLTHALSPHRRFLLHAAAVELAGSGWLVLGDSGMGKSTTAFAAHRGGRGVLDDDFSIVRSSPGQGVEVSGFGPLAIAVPDEVLEADARETLTAAPGDLRRRRTFHAQAATGWFPLGGSIVVGHAPGPVGTLTRTAPAPALAALLRACQATIDPHRLPGFFRLAVEVSRRPAYQLLHGRDPATRLRDAQRNLQEIVDRCGGEMAGSSPAGATASPTAIPASS